MEQLTLKSVETAVRSLSERQGNLLMAQLMRHVFDMVADKKDWRAPIDCRLAKRHVDVDADVIRKAVLYMTAAPCTIDDDGETLHVKCIGYRNGPAGP